MKKTINNSKNFSVFCWNIGNPSKERATKQAEWICKRDEDIFVLTEAKKSDGCLFLENYFLAYGYNVVFPKPEGGEYGVIIVSKHPIKYSNFSTSIDYLSFRTVSVRLNFQKLELEIIGTYVPSRNASFEKIEKKKKFLKNLIDIFSTKDQLQQKIFCGDFNILEPNHIPHYSFFKEWEYNFYRDLKQYQFLDAFRCINPEKNEYSWVGRTGDGYRYDHCFISNDFLYQLKDCYYFHEPRQIRLSDHSALITSFNF